VSQGKLPALLKFYGVSPWELEVLYGLLNGMFQVKENPDAEKEEEFSTMIDVTFPLEFNEAFFKWFGSARWEKLKGILKELKRRRGSGKTLRVYILFTGRPNIKFIVDLAENNWFYTAIEKIDFVLELLPYQLNPKQIPQNITDVIYEFNETAGKWNVHGAFANEQTYVYSKNEWKLI